VPFHRLTRALAHQLARRGRLHLLRVFSRPLRVPACPPAPPPGLELRSVSAAELRRHSADPALGLREPMIADVLGRGDLCLGALEGGILAGYVWLAYEAAPHVHGIWVQVPARAVYLFKSFIRPSHRGRGIAAALYRAADALATRPGRELVVSCVEAHNHPSIALSLKDGSRPLGALAYWRAGPWYAAFHSPAVRRLGLRFYLA
jgi:GNAT superfamily N-acetyltransferase